MKFTIDARLIKSSGIGVYIQNILKSELFNEYQLNLLVNSEDITFAKSICANAKCTPYNANLYSLKELIKTPFKTIGTEIFWSPHYNIPIVNFASKLKITTIHDVFHLAYYDTLNRKQKIYSKLMLSKAVNSSDVIFTVSNFSKAEIIKYLGCDAEKIKVVYNGIDFRRFNNNFSKEQEATVLNKHNILTNYILFVGNVKPHKNLKNALLGFKAYHQLKQSLTTLKFLIVGKKDGFITGDTEVKAMIDDMFFKDKVQFTGWVADEDLPVLYQKASLFIFPSIYEGFGFPAMEAMAAGCPVISSNAACMREVYENAASYFDPLNPQEIGEKIYEVLSNNEIKSALVREGFLQARQFSWRDSIKQKFSIIHDALNNKN